VLGHASAQGGSGMVASNAVSAEEAAAVSATLSPGQGRSKGVRFRCMGWLLGRLLGLARDEHGIFSICSKKFN
jgi:hypothetical protein